MDQEKADGSHEGAAVAVLQIADGAWLFNLGSVNRFVHVVAPGQHAELKEIRLVLEMEQDSSSCEHFGKSAKTIAYSG